VEKALPQILQPTAQKKWKCKIKIYLRQDLITKDLSFKEYIALACYYTTWQNV